jgi:hypothetical protein
MKKAFGVAALLLLAAAAIYLFPTPKAPPPAMVAPEAQTSSANLVRTSVVVPSVPTSIVASISPTIISSQHQSQPPIPAPAAGRLVPDSTSSTEVGPETALQNVRRAVHQYGEMFGGNPVGTNPEITSQLSGDNPKHINFINPQPGAHVNADGELVDAWGTPYFFHQISSSDMEIHSAGPDKVMWTSDDLVVK